MRTDFKFQALRRLFFLSKVEICVNYFSCAKDNLCIKNSFSVIAGCTRTKEDILQHVRYGYTWFSKKKI